MTDQDPNAFGSPSAIPAPPGLSPAPTLGFPPPRATRRPRRRTTYPRRPVVPAGRTRRHWTLRRPALWRRLSVDTARRVGRPPGSLGSRFGARVIDGILVGIFASLLAALFKSSGSILVTGLFTGLLMFVYFVAFEVTQGRTLGKRLLGLSVRGPGGAPKPDLKQSAIRNAFTLLPIVPFIGGVLGVVAIVVIAMTINSSPTKQGKHDEMAGGTQVVKS